LIAQMAYAGLPIGAATPRDASPVRVKHGPP